MSRRPSFIGREHGLLLALAVLVVVALPVVQLPLGFHPAFLPVFFALIVAADTATALIVAARFRWMGGPALVLAATYAFAGLIVLPHAFAFPRIVVESGGFPGRPDVTVWLWAVWHVVFAMGLLVSGLPVAHRWDTVARGRARGLVGVALAVATAVAAATVLVVVTGRALPTVINGDDYAALWNSGVGPVVLAVSAVCLGAKLLLGDRTTSLQRWGTVALGASVADVLLVMLAGERYTVGWYGGRMLALAASGAVLMAVVREVEHLQRELEQSHRDVRSSAARLRENNRLLQSVLESSPDSIFIKGRGGRYLLANPAAAAILGAPPDEVVGRTDAELLASPEAARALAAGDEQVLARQASHTSDGIWLGDDVGRYLAWTKVPYRGPDGQLLGLIGVARDVTDQRRSEDARRAAERRFERAFADSPIGIALLDGEGRCMQANLALAQILGITPEQIVGQPLEAFAATENGGVERAARESLRSGHDGSWQGELSYRHAAGHTVVTLATLTRVDDEPSESYFIAQRVDISERRRAQAQLAHQALHDPLTGLPNRALLLDRLQHVIDQRRRGPEHLAALLFIDLDRFKPINDSLGHEAGDAVLMEVARRLLAVIRPGDTVARLGGDEFTLIADELTAREDASQLAARVRDTIERPIAIGEREVFVSASIGIAFSDEEADAAALLRDADSAMYRAKQGTGPVTFDRSLRSLAAERLQTEADLRCAAERDEVVVVYQPQVELATGRVQRLEALARWRRAGGRFVRPDDFIPIAEETGLIVPIGRRVLERACQDARALELDVAVNISAVQLADATLPEQVARALQRAELEPARLQLEITESVLMRDIPTTHHVLSQLHELGVRLAIDDFGSGYSALAFLQRFPIDTLKIDRSLIGDLGRTDPADQLVRALVAMAEALGLSIVAEGVETSEQARVLSGLGCHLAQGYLLGRPQLLDDLIRSANTAFAHHH